MDTKLKQRILGIAVVAAVAVIVVPLFLGHNNKNGGTQQVTLTAKIPDAPTPPTLTMNDNSNAPAAIQAQEAQQLNPQGNNNTPQATPVAPNEADASAGTNSADNTAAGNVTASTTQPAFNPAANQAAMNANSNSNATSGASQQPAFNPSQNNTATAAPTNVQSQPTTAAQAPAVSRKKQTNNATVVRGAANNAVATNNNSATIPAFNPNSANSNAANTSTSSNYTANTTAVNSSATSAQQNGSAPIVQATPVYVRDGSNATAVPKTVAKNTNSVQQPRVKQPVVADAASTWSIQVGSFSQEKNAKALATKLKSSGLAAYTQSVNTNKGVSTRVLIGPEGDRARADAIVAVLSQKYQIKAVVVPYRA